MATARIEPQGAPTHQLVIKDVFDRLTPQEKLYAHHLSQAAWSSAKVIMRQTSPESTKIFDFIMQVYKSCGGHWREFLGFERGRVRVTEKELAAFPDYAALFLSNLGNYYADGGKMIIPSLSLDALHRLARGGPKSDRFVRDIFRPVLSSTRVSIEYPSDVAYSNYYPRDRITWDELFLVSKFTESQNIGPENTRVFKWKDHQGKTYYDVFQASSVTGCIARSGDIDGLGQGAVYVSNEKQAKIIDSYIASFLTGNLGAFEGSQKVWVTDKSPRVETIFGFVEPYWDPHGVRARWEAIVCISDPTESSRYRQLVEHADAFICLMPWALPGINSGKGHFEKELFQAPNFATHASCSSIIRTGIDLPKDNNIRETCGFKNLIIANRVAAPNDVASLCRYVQASEVERYKECVATIEIITTAVHELLGHGTGKLLSETSPGVYNFDKNNPPINPINGKAVETWYRPGQTWDSVFGEMGVALEEYRAVLFSVYLMDNRELLAMFGHDDTTRITADDLLYNTYLHIGVEGLRALKYLNAEEQAWREPYRSTEFAILKHVQLHGGGVLDIEHDPGAATLTVKVDRNKLLSHGKPCLGGLLCAIHIWRCTADDSCTWLYKKLSAVDGKYEDWRKIVYSKPEPHWKFCQANTVLGSDGVVLKVYDESNEGIIQSWAERVNAA
ncbi:peptidase family M49-domain-containing protein [Podospora australis]|uniref:Peptidase family M49-domain-containing protein n=1 Tax=Podospora australis TaxID=1536484 RepID=A0AAN6WN22_9PEZI|nr:peptidase family M49-domain-containing protein [Podospora australis]